MRRIVLTASLALLTLAGRAWAQEVRDEDYFRPSRNFYIGAGGLVSVVPGDANASALGLGGPSFGNFRDAFGTGFGVLGYFGGPLTDHSFAQIAVGIDLFDGAAGDLTVNWNTAELKLVPFDRARYSPYLIVGLGVAVASIDPPGTASKINTDVEFTFTVGAGMDFYLSESVAFEPEVRFRYLDDRRIQMFPFNFGANFLFYFE